MTEETKPPCDCLQCRVRALMMAWSDEAPENELGQAIADVQAMLAFTLVRHSDPNDVMQAGANHVAGCIRSLNDALEHMKFPFRIATVSGTTSPEPHGPPPTAH